MKTITLSTLTAIALVGCGGGSGGDATTTTTSASTKKVITYQNGNVFGETCGDFVSSNGIEGVNVCEVGTGNNVIGFLRTDATVTDKGGSVVGECSPDFDISVMGKEGDTQGGTCALSVNEDYADKPKPSDTSKSGSSDNSNDTSDNSNDTSKSGSSDNSNDTSSGGSSDNSNDTSSGTGNDGALPIVDLGGTGVPTSGTATVDTGNQGAPDVLQ